MDEQIIGDYKIEPRGFVLGHCAVRKALGPWPLKNWSWISFYDGTAEQCREYVRWAERVNAGDQELIKHATDWLAAQIGSPVRSSGIAVEHLPKTWRYDFKSALSTIPPQPEAGASAELVLAIIAIVVFLGGAFLYHSV